jgi:predicted MFS family arabinose efflux permease
MMLPAIWASLKMRHVELERPARRTLSVDPASAPSAQAAFPTGALVLLATICLLRGAGMGATFTFLNVYMDTDLHMPTALIGSLRGIAQAVGVGVALMTPLLVQRWGNGRTYVGGLAVTAICMILLAVVPTAWSAAVTLLGTEAMMALVIPTFTVFQMELVDPIWRSTMSGTTSMAMAVSRSLMSLLGGVLVASAGYGGVFVIGGGLVGLASLVFWVALLRRRSPVAAPVSVRPAINR